jgi:hypothetical protein
MTARTVGPLVLGLTVLISTGVGGITGSMGSPEEADWSGVTAVAPVPVQYAPVQGSINWTLISATGLCGPPESFSATVQFFGNGTGGSPPYTFYWTFGDGSAASTLQNPEHKYTTAPDVAMLTVMDSEDSHENTSTTLAFATSCPSETVAPLTGGATVILVFGAAAGIVVGSLSYRRRRGRRELG